LGDSSRARLRVRHLVRVYLEPVALEPYLLTHVFDPPDWHRNLWAVREALLLLAT
jgi:hypothetical protein